MSDTKVTTEFAWKGTAVWMRGPSENVHDEGWQAVKFVARKGIQGRRILVFDLGHGRVVEFDVSHPDAEEQIKWMFRKPNSALEVEEPLIDEEEKKWPEQ